MLDAAFIRENLEAVQANCRNRNVTADPEQKDQEKVLINPEIVKRHSVTEEEDKPLKYPLMVRSVALVLAKKIDLLPTVDFDLAPFHDHLDAVNPGVERILMSARTGQGIEEWCSWIARRRPAALARERG